MSKEDYDFLQETIYLLSSPVNAARLLRAAADVREGKNLTEVSLDDLKRVVEDIRPSTALGGKKLRAP